jgi:flagellar hook protein FlgE
MLRSLYSGISGMKVNQTKLDVVGNNVANVGTTSFKTSRTRFQDMLSQNVNSALAPSLNQGGVNATKVGLGVKLAGTDTVMTQGSMQPTSRNLDMAVDGEGYFMAYKGPVAFADGAINVDNNTLGNVSGDVFYTRDGAFTLDSDGNLLNSDGLRILGYGVTGGGSTSLAPDGTSNYVNPDALDLKATEDLRTLRIPEKIMPTTEQAAAKEKAVSDYEIAQANANAQKAIAETAAIPAAAAAKAEKTLAEAKVAAALAVAKVAKATADVTTATANKTIADTTKTVKAGELTAAQAAVTADPTNADKIKALSEATAADAKADLAVTQANKALADANDTLTKANGEKTIADSAVTLGQTDYAAKQAAATAAEPNRLATEAAAAAAIKEASEKETIAKAAISSGSELRIISFTVEKGGLIKAVCEGGKVSILGQIAMSSFKNPGGLEKIGGNLYRNSPNSGEPVIRTGVGAENDNGKGYGDVLQGMLEMSNVDLAEQFTEMIVTSRAFQASGKMITTGDEILQDIINLKR